MYNIKWDCETRGYELVPTAVGVQKEIRPVFYEELELLGFGEYWKYPKTNKPLLWAEGTRRYIYQGELVAEAHGGSFYTKPRIEIKKHGLHLEPVDIEGMVQKNKALMTGLVQNSLEFIYKTFKKYRKRNFDICYVAFSGGKDSLVVLDLVQRALSHDDFVVVFGDTGMEVKSTYQAVDRAKKRWSTIKFFSAVSSYSPQITWKEFGPPSRIHRWCCSVHKTAPSLLLLRHLLGKDNIRALVFDGVRSEESELRYPEGFLDKKQKLTMISRLLPFVEKRLNLIELAPKGTGKSYLFSQISKYGWLVSGGSITRARLFYDINKRMNGLVSHYDYVALDEIQSISFPNQEEIQGALKGYLESGEFRIGDYRGIGEAGFVLLGNIKESLMNIEVNMFQELPPIFHESALLDRFHGFIKGWDIPRMKENMKAQGWALNVEYFSEIMHLLRDDIIYRAVVDEILEVPKGADTRDTEAIKRICTGFMKLLFPHVRDIDDIDATEFVEFCLNPAKSMRAVIKKQLGIIDREFSGKDIPDITCKLLNQ